MTDLDLTILEVTPPWEWPNDAAEAVLKRLRDNQGDEAERLLAAELAGEIVIVSQDLTKALSAIVADRGASDELRGRAAIALGPVLEEMDLHEPLGDELDELDPPPIPPHEFQRIRWELQAVYRAADTPKEVRRRILEASVRAPEAWHEDAIREAYGRDDDEWRLTAIFCMGRVQGFASEILASLNDPAEAVRFEAVQAAGLREIRAAWPHVAHLLRSPDTDRQLLLAAIEASVGVRGKATIEFLDDLSASEDEEIAEAAEEATMMANALYGDLSEW